MALGDVTLDDGQSTPVSHTFTYISTGNGKVVRADMDAPAEEPLTMTFGHQQKKVSGKTLRQHLVRFDRVKMDADGVTPHLTNVRLMADVPDAIRSDALADDFAAFIRNWATSANVRAWLKDSVG